MDRKPPPTNNGGRQATMNGADSTPTMASVNDKATTSIGGEGEIPFLVTHWLANYVRQQKKEGLPDAEQKAIIDKISNATNEIASAFSSLGAFGTTVDPTFLASSVPQQSTTRNASYSDLSRKWSGLPASHLENLAQAVVSNGNTAAVASYSSIHTNLLLSAGESKDQKEGRTVNDAIDIDGSGDSNVDNVALGGSILQKPILLSANVTAKSAPGVSGEEAVVRVAEASPNPMTPVNVQSSYADVAKKTANTMRRYLDLRETVQSTGEEIMSLEISKDKHEQKWKALDARFKQISIDTEMESNQKLAIQDEIKDEKQNCERVSTQLRRKLTELKIIHSTRIKELAQLQAEVNTLESQRKAVVKHFRDPLGKGNHHHTTQGQMGSNYLLQSVLSRQHGLPRSRRRPLPLQSPLTEGIKPWQSASTKKALIGSRFAATAIINAHLNLSVYCLRFDRSGRYFITGADDFSSKVFYLGPGRSCKSKNAVDGSRQLRCNYGANLKGAVLVCTLRGHAAVINDIDVSPDNCFLATASADSDVRVWGLKDGCPIAVLRGHNIAGVKNGEGANMVSWSTLTPYRLVTTSSDGFARVWDIREACLKRYPAHVGKRAEYKLDLTDSEMKEERDHDNAHTPTKQVNGGESANILPPLPRRDGTAGSETANGILGSPQIDRAARSQSNGIVVPPLPAAVPPLPGAEADGAVAGGENNNANPGDQNNAIQQDIPLGQFVPNETIDEGVKLLKKYQHGSAGEDVAGPGTRSRRGKVNVICVARCPLGGHFITGSDDGICRVWKEVEDHKVTIVDRRHSRRPNLKIPRSDLVDTGKPLMKLMGHISAITDLAYSYSGDRFLSASQKDGVIRVWSIGASGIWRGKSNERNVTQVVIKLTNPTGSTVNTQRRRAPGNATRTETSKVSCDVAVWTRDDAYIISSQSILLKQSGTEIQPGSQYLFLWNSHTGQCLMGFSGAHTMQCPVVIPHPDDSSLVLTAAADGHAKLWDWETGRCIFTHKNKECTNPDASTRSKLAGFLDGAWGPGGTNIVLTDDSGSVTILDSSDHRNCNENIGPAWMSEQYFASDYYDLAWDTHGYCIEKGSEQPPHLAPKGARVSRSSAPWSDEINETFAKLVGPLPLPENVCRFRRERIRSNADAAGTNVGNLLSVRQTKVRRGVREFDPSSTIMVRASGHVDPADKKAKSQSRMRDTETARSEETRALSSNYRYLGYDDIIRREGDPDDEEVVDSDDEEFEPGARNASSNARQSDDSDDELDADDLDVESPRRLGGRNHRRSEPTARARQQRAQRRSRNRDDFVEIGSDDEGVVEIMSTNNNPSGPYERDYTIWSHFWRAPTSGRIRRKWVRRMESDTSYRGQKIYTPQVGDSVVYIPRAHFETLKDFPSLPPPWQHWPQEAVWPVVRCLVRGIRYRFPYEDYFRGSQTRCTSVVAILTLEVTGIPELSGERRFPWPKPSFVQPSRRHLFELSLFEYNNSEFIFPESLYVGRLQALENTITERDTRRQGAAIAMEGLDIHLYYSEQQTNNQEDLEMTEYNATIMSLQQEEPFHIEHLMGSGYGIIQADCENWVDNWSPWEVVIDGSTSERPSLSEEGKKFIIAKLTEEMRKPNVREYFNEAVDESRYSDYKKMVEVEMNFMFIKRRLTENYYCSKLSVASDMRLIRDNCIKYNTIRNELSTVACKVVDSFEAAVLSSEERALLITEEEFSRFEQEPQHHSTEGEDLSSANNHSTTQRYNLRNRSVTQGRSSSLENLPRARPARRAANRNELDRGTRRSARARGEEPPESPGVDDLLGRRRPMRMAPSLNEPQANTRRPSRPRGRQLIAQDSLGRLTRSARSQDEEEVSRDASEDESENESSGEEVVRQTASRSRGGALNTRRGARSARAPVNESDDDDVESPRASGRATRNPSGRTRSRRTTIASDEDEEMNSEEEDSVEADEVAPASRPRISISVRGRANAVAQPSARTSPRSNRRAAARIRPPESPTRRSSRAGTRARQSYEEEASDFESPDEESPDEESAVESEPESEPEETPPRKRSRKRAKYAEIPSDYEEEEVSEDDDDEEEERPRDRSTRKRQKASPPESPPSPAYKRRKSAPQSSNFEDNSEWPEIDVKAVTRVCQSVLEKVAQADHDNVFRVPVAEAYPNLAESYLAIVKNPIDLRTIEEERVQGYKSILELQQDLIHMFENCITFNGRQEDMGIYAMELRGRLNTLFQEACDDEHVLLPRRW